MRISGFGCMSSKVLCSHNASIFHTRTAHTQKNSPLDSPALNFSWPPLFITLKVCVLGRASGEEREAGVKKASGSGVDQPVERMSPSLWLCLRRM